MKKSVHLALEENEIIELIRILMDDDPEGALEFLKAHFRGKARDLLESGWKVMLDVPGAGQNQIQASVFKRTSS